MSCSSGLHWSILDNMCMDADDANCPFEDDENEEISKDYEDNGCPSTGISSIPNSESCEEYFLCVNGNKLARNCPNGLHFSRSTLTCTDPDTAQCFLDGCPPNELGFLPHEDDCTKYYLCFWGNKHLMRCPNDLHWSVEENACLDEQEAGCEDFDDNIECPPTGIDQIPYPDDCEKYVLCINGVEIVLTCAPGLHFSPTTRTCQTPEKAECEDSDAQEWTCPEQDEPGVIVFIPNTEDCSAYYLCWQGRQIPLTCGIGKHF